MEYICEYCAHTAHDSERMIRLMTEVCGRIVCYECALEWAEGTVLAKDAFPFQLLPAVLALPAGE